MAKKRAVGLDISDHAIKIVDIEQQRDGNIIVHSSYTLMLEQDIVTHGRIVDSDALKTRLETAFASANPPIAPRGVIFGLPDPQTYVYVTRLQATKQKDIDKALSTAVAKVIPLPQEDIIYAYQVVEETAEQSEVRVVASSKTVMREWQALFQSLAIDIEFFDLEVLALARDLDLPQEGLVCIANIGAQSASFSFFDETGLRYTQTSHSAGDAFTKAVGGGKEGEERKKQYGIAQPDKAHAQALKRALSQLSTELSRATAYASKSIGKPVAEVVVVGGASQLHGLFEHLQQHVGLPIRVGGSSRIADSVDVTMLSAIGLALRGADTAWDKRDPSLPLVKKEKKKQRQKKSATAETVSVAQYLDGSVDDDSKNQTRRQLILFALILIVGALALVWAVQYRAQQRAEAEKARALDAAAAALSVVEQAAEEDTLLEEESSEDEDESALAQFVLREGVTSTPLYQEPSTSTPAIGSITVLDAFQFIELDGSEAWYKIAVTSTDGVTSTGWVEAQFMNYTLGVE